MSQFEGFVERLLVITSLARGNRFIHKSTRMNARTFEEVDLVHEQFDTHYFSFARIYNEQQRLPSRSYAHSISFQCFKPQEM